MQADVHHLSAPVHLPVGPCLTTLSHHTRFELGLSCTCGPFTLHYCSYWLFLRNCPLGISACFPSKFEFPTSVLFSFHIYQGETFIFLPHPWVMFAVSFSLPSTEVSGGWVISNHELECRKTLHQNSSVWTWVYCLASSISHYFLYFFAGTCIYIILLSYKSLGRKKHFSTNYGFLFL